MSPQEALSILDQATSLVSLPRKDHVVIQQALDLLSECLKNGEPKDKGEFDLAAKSEENSGEKNG